MDLAIALDLEEDGRWIAEAIDLPGVLVYGDSREEALLKVQVLALRVVADLLEHEEASPELLNLCFVKHESVA